MLFMAAMSWPQLYEYYLAWNMDGINIAYRKASKTCFDKCYNERWSNMLRIRGEGQHGRCKRCAENSKEIRDAQTKEEKNVARSPSDAPADDLMGSVRGLMTGSLKATGTFFCCFLHTES